MNRRNSIIAAVIVLVLLILVATASAAPAPKFFVCKYVGTPGQDETLQTGQNPISVSGNALPNGTQVGDSFADAQGRSHVIAEDTGQEEPECPEPENPPEPPEEPETPKEEEPDLSVNGTPEVEQPEVVEVQGK